MRVTTPKYTDRIRHLDMWAQALHLAGRAVTPEAAVAEVLRAGLGEQGSRFTRLMVRYELNDILRARGIPLPGTLKGASGGSAAAASSESTGSGGVQFRDPQGPPDPKPPEHQPTDRGEQEPPPQPPPNDIE